jgi:hypothetical protein
MNINDFALDGTSKDLEAHASVLLELKSNTETLFSQLTDFYGSTWTPVFLYPRTTKL